MRWTVSILVAVAAALVAAPFARGGAWLWVWAALALAIIWIAVPVHGYDWTAPIGLIGFTLLAGAGLLRFDTFSFALPGIVVSLAAWDLSNLAQRLDKAGGILDRHAYLRAHLLQLGTVLGGAWLLAYLGTRTGFRVGFLWALALILLLVLSLGRIVKSARQTEID